MLQPMGLPAPSQQSQRWARRLVVGVLFGSLIIRTWLIIDDWNFGDINAYWLAAERLKHGEPLYLGSLDPDSYRVFRYAPWFAWLWVPLTYLPREIAVGAWTLLLAGTSIWVLVGLARLRSVAAWGLVFVMTPWFLSLVQVGNVQPLVVAALGYGLARRTGPLWLGLAGALKATPLIFGLVYLADRQWRRLALSLVAAAALFAPYFLYDLSGYQTDPGRSYSFYYYVSPEAWMITAAASVAVAVLLAIRRSPYVWVAAAIAVGLVAPRTHVTYATYLVIGLLGRGTTPHGQPGR